MLLVACAIGKTFPVTDKIPKMRRDLLQKQHREGARIELHFLFFVEKRRKIFDKYTRRVNNGNIDGFTKTYLLGIIVTQ